MKYIVVLILLVFCSCSKDITDPVTSTDAERRAKMDVFMRGEGELVGFKEHNSIKREYRVSGPNDVKRTNVTSRLEEHQFIVSATRDVNTMSEKYPEVKSALSDWISKNENDEYAWEIQTLSLRYLRSFFLLDHQSAYVSEVSYLLDILVDTESIDLDVLADAFYYCSQNLSDSDRDRYFSYIEQLLHDEMKTIRTQGLKCKEKYENSTGADRARYLGYGKKLERRSKACQYASDLLGIEVPPGD